MRTIAKRYNGRVESVGAGSCLMPVASVLAPAAPVRTAFRVLLGVFAFLSAALFASTRFLRIRRRQREDSPFGAYMVERSIGKAKRVIDVRSKG